MYLKRSKLTFNYLNYDRIVTIQEPKTLFDKIKIGWQMFAGVLKQGTKDCYYDYKIVRSYDGKFTNGQQIYKNYHVRREIVKVFPFIMLFMAPGGFIYLPIYATFFPNAIPTYYTFSEQYYDRLDRKQNLSKDAQLKLYYQQNIIKNARNSNELKEIFLLKKDVIEKQLNINQLNSDQLNLICQHLQMEYLSLLNVPHKLYHFAFNFHIYIKQLYDFVIKRKNQQYYFQDPYKILNIGRPFFIEFIRQKLLLYQINQYLEYIHIADQLHQFQDQNYSKYCSDRGLQNKMPLEQYNNDWVRFTLQNNLTNTQKVWFSIFYSQLK